MTAVARPSTPRTKALQHLASSLSLGGAMGGITFAAMRTDLAMGIGIAVAASLALCAESFARHIASILGAGGEAMTAVIEALVTAWMKIRLFGAGIRKAKNMEEILQLIRLLQGQDCDKTPQPGEGSGGVVVALHPDE